MKRPVFFLLFLVACLAGHSQATDPQPEKKTRKFHVGVSYTYLSTDMKITSLTMHSVWQGQDFGTSEATGDELDDINSFVKRTGTVNGISLEAGMVLLSKPTTNFHIEGDLIAGIANSYTRIYNKNSGKEEQTFNSGLKKPFLGLKFDITYRFTPAWGLSLRPLFACTWGVTTDITDDIYPPAENFTETRTDDFFFTYHRSNLMATFTVKRFTVAIGPGFYLVQTNHKYKINRTNNESGYLLTDEFNSKLVSTAFIDGAIALEWRIIDLLTLTASGAFGADVTASAGLRCNF
ncbi:MAG: hypothetical protein NTW10_00210 [Bacteroidetes bacterium]|nr:hypothetical protein [Bacteroidota bacterium]